MFTQIFCLDSNPCYFFVLAHIIDNNVIMLLLDIIIIFESVSQDSFGVLLNYILVLLKYMWNYCGHKKIYDVSNITLLNVYSMSFWLIRWFGGSVCHYFWELSSEIKLLLTAVYLMILSCLCIQSLFRWCRFISGYSMLPSQFEWVALS